MNDKLSSIEKSNKGIFTILFIGLLVILNLAVFGFITPELISAKSTPKVFLGFVVFVADAIVTFLLGRRVYWLLNF